jgi:hypothetical protein
MEYEELFPVKEFNTFKDACEESKDMPREFRNEAVVKRSDSHIEKWAVLIPESRRNDYEAYLKEERDNLIWETLEDRVPYGEDDDWDAAQSDDAYRETGEIVNDIYSDADDWSRSYRAGWFYDN